MRRLRLASGTVCSGRTAGHRAGDGEEVHVGKRDVIGAERPLDRLDQRCPAQSPGAAHQDAIHTFTDSVAVITHRRGAAALVAPSSSAVRAGMRGVLADIGGPGVDNSRAGVGGSGRAGPGGPDLRFAGSGRCRPRPRKPTQLEAGRQSHAAGRAPQGLVDQVFAAIRAEPFLILPSPEVHTPVIRARMDASLKARNPALPGR